MIIILLLALLAAIGIVMTTLQVIVTWSLIRIPLPTAEGRDSSLPGHVSILKPISGLEDGLEENFASFARLRGISYEVIVSVADPCDPALEVVERIRRRFPDAPFSLVVGGVRQGRVMNPKVERLIAAMEIARGDCIFISDSNIRVSPEDIADTLAAFRDPSVGCISNLFVGEENASPAALIEGLYLLTFVVPGNALADAGEVACVIGKSMAIRREVLDCIGGFEAFANLLAEDQAIGLAVLEAGYELALSPVVVRNVIGKRTLRAALARQIRWGKIRYSFSKATYTSEFLITPFPMSLLACIASMFLAPDSLFSLSVFAATTMLIRMGQARALAALTGAKFGWAEMMLVPAQDVLQFTAQFVPYFSKEVVWRNHRARIGRGTLMMPSRRDLPAGRQAEA